MYFQRKANKKATLISRNEKVVFCSDSISAMWADTVKMPWKIMEIKPLQMAVASANLPQSTQKAASGTLEAASHSSRHWRFPVRL